ncbi:MAG: 5-formyltetrahydrofolate cyclo-ligase [Betaproteobacteria bacterium]|nr:5-formyltetrahydrofolate cyclo-ligase [Betaproteobacteria bacterium]
MGAETNLEKTADERLAYRRSLRRTMLERRLAMSAERCALYSAALCRHLRASFPQLSAMRVAFCWPVRNEPDLTPLLEEWRAARTAGFAALLPVVIEENAPLAFRPWSPETRLVADRYGIPMPESGGFVTPEALLLPLNAFDAAFYRLGYGGGYFDRTLASLQTPAGRPLAIGVGFELARVGSIRPEPHDFPLDAIITEAGVRFRGADLRSDP